MHPNCVKKRELKSKSSRTTSCECAPLRGTLLLWLVGRSDLSHVLFLCMDRCTWGRTAVAVNLNKQRKPECHPGFIQNRSPVCKNICAPINSESMNFSWFFSGPAVGKLNVEDFGCRWMAILPSINHCLLACWICLRDSGIFILNNCQSMRPVWLPQLVLTAGCCCWRESKYLTITTCAAHQPSPDSNSNIVNEALARRWI